MVQEIDAETLAIMVSYCGRDPRVAREITAQALTVYAEESWSLADFQEVIAEAVASIPEDRRDSANVDLEGSYDETGKLIITYKRLETPEEVAANVKRALEYAGRKRAEERAQYERLKAKFNP